MAEGRSIRMKAEQEAADIAANEAAVRARAIEAQHATLRANEVLRAVKAKEVERDRQADLAIQSKYNPFSTSGCFRLLQDNIVI